MEQITSAICSLALIIKQSPWASKAPPRRSASPAHFSSASARAPLVHRSRSLAYWRASGTDRRLLYIVDQPPLVMTQWTDRGENGKCSRLETVSAPLRLDSATASFFASSSLFFLDRIPRWGVSFWNCTSVRDGVRRTGTSCNSIRLTRHQTFRFGPSLKRWCGKSCKQHAVKHPAAPDRTVSGEMGQLWNSHTDSVE